MSQNTIHPPPPPPSPPSHPSHPSPPPPPSPKGKRILVCGSRYWDDEKKIRSELERFPVDTVVITGGANGADRLGDKVAKSLGMKSIVFPANWNKYGRAAGPIRNQQMLNEGQPDLILAFHNNLSSSLGTKNMVSLAKNKGVECRIIN